MHRLQLLSVLFLFGSRAAAQTCPAINFRNASQVAMTVGNVGSGLQRLSDGSFTLRSYTSQGTIATAQQLPPTPDYQTDFSKCNGRTSGPVVPPANWSFLGDPLVGAMARNPAIGNFLGNGMPVGICLQPCGVNSSLLQMMVSNASGNIVSSPSYTVGQDTYGFLIADLNNDGLGDVIVQNSDFPNYLSS